MPSGQIVAASDAELASGVVNKHELKEMERRMWEAVERLDFELAAELRDRIKSLRDQDDGKFGFAVDKNKRRPSAQFKKHRRRTAKK
jgi:excinuclease ABC subunit B